MRLYDIAMILALFGVVMGLMDSSDWFHGGDITVAETGVTKDELQKIKGVGENTAESSGGVLDTVTSGWTVLNVMINAFYRVLWIHDIIVDVFISGASDDLSRMQVKAVAGVVQTGIWMVYGIGLLQLFRKSSIKHME